MTRLLVTGSRDYTDYETVSRGMTVAIETLVKNHPEDKVITLVHGAAKGADSLADNFMYRARKVMASYGYTIVIEPHAADWEKWGKAAGPIRNKEMVALGADICVAFIRNQSRGASHCRDLARAAGIEILEYH